MRPIASLSSSLLARKGQARPAMRPQAFAGQGADAVPGDDLGWNDMGAAEPVMASPSADLPPVLVERAALTEDVARIAAATAADVAEAAPPIVDDLVRKGAIRTAKAAFTLRLPADRHLRLRLASAVTHRSAQAIVTEALDAFLSTLPDVQALAGRCASPDRLGTPS